MSVCSSRCFPCDESGDIDVLHFISMPDFAWQVSVSLLHRPSGSRSRIQLPTLMTPSIPVTENKVALAFVAKLGLRWLVLHFALGRRSAFELLLHLVSTWAHSTGYFTGTLIKTSVSSPRLIRDCAIDCDIQPLFSSKLLQHRYSESEFVLASVRTSI